MAKRPIARPTSWRTRRSTRDATARSHERGGWIDIAKRMLMARRGCCQGQQARLRLDCRLGETRRREPEARTVGLATAFTLSHVTQPPARHWRAAWAVAAARAATSRTREA